MRDERPTVTAAMSCVDIILGLANERIRNPFLRTLADVAYGFAIIVVCYFSAAVIGALYLTMMSPTN